MNHIEFISNRTNIGLVAFLVLAISLVFVFLCLILNCLTLHPWPPCVLYVGPCLSSGTVYMVALY